MGTGPKVTLSFVFLTAVAGAADLKPRTVQAFDDYVRRLESRLNEQLKTPAFLWADASPKRALKVRQGQVLVESLTGKGPQAVPDGLIHDWVGAVFIPGTTLEKTLAMVKDYNRRKDLYKPEVIDSRLVGRRGDDFQIYMRLLKKKVITVVLDTYYDASYQQLDPTRCYSRSYSTRIQEVNNPGKPNERLEPEGKDHGFLWRLHSFWRFAERDGGVWVECEAVSLTRDIPMGLGWLIEPIIRDLPRESLVGTLEKTRDALR